VTLSVAPGEGSKTPRQLLNLAQEMVWQEAKRSTPVIALGGGVVGDLAGFAASLYMRGVPLLHIPTTLLAQVDSSIGGKTGIDLPEGKNLLGTFWQPEAVWTWIGFLKTLSPTQIQEGLSESLKYGYILKPEILQLACSIDPKDPMANEENLLSLIHHCTESKARVVREDVNDQGRRQILNFGHTIGHALETISGYQGMTHGQAVAIGMVVETFISEAIGIAKKGLTADVYKRLQSLGLPTKIPSKISVERIIDACKRDKKRSSKEIPFALVSTPGQCEIHQIEAPELLKILRSL
jgi:3-dehydroquinate synthase